MRLPDLDWPADLYAEDSSAEADCTGLLSSMETTQSLWTDLVNVWVRCGIAPSFQVAGGWPRPAHLIS
jgi:hypothetical protein